MPGFMIDPRKVCMELCKARCLTKLGEYYCAGKLSRVGHSPVPAPSPLAVKSRKTLMQSMGEPFKMLHVTNSGALIIPTDEEILQLNAAVSWHVSRAAPSRMFKGLIAKQCFSKFAP